MCKICRGTLCLLLCTREGVKQHFLKGRTREFFQCGDVFLGALKVMKNSLKKFLLFLLRQHNSTYKITVLSISSLSCHFWPFLPFTGKPPGQNFAWSLEKSLKERQVTDRMSGNFPSSYCNGKNKECTRLKKINRWRLLSLHGWRRWVNSYLFGLWDVFWLYTLWFGLWCQHTS